MVLSLDLFFMKDLTEQQIMEWCFESMEPGEKEAIENETLVSFQKLDAWTQNQLDTTSGNSLGKLKVD